MKEFNIVKCPDCRCDEIRVVATSEHVVQFACNNLKCRKNFCKEYK